AWMEEHAGSIAELEAHIGQNGPVRSADFTHPRKGASGWWEWKPHKRHLEGLFTAGEVMVVERRNFHRVYDLTRRVMPDWDDERDALSREDAEAIMLRNSARSLGIFRGQRLVQAVAIGQPPPGADVDATDATPQHNRHCGFSEELDALVESVGHNRTG
ncbi:DNA glycosylase AlkZ-like family protein, partial [Stenotrophomonas maltophilia]|uniref:DNA glycosylase AlkZ-like family protein n=1 Tax=Stenotrophomonas maltophilia TaxID=40324 RepID=UPI00314551B1